MTSFSDFGLEAPILKALAEEGHEHPTPIQAQSIPYVLAGRDLLGIAQTGTGKTAAFALPILNRLAASHTPLQPRSARVLVLSPTRELSNQTRERFDAYGRHLRLRSAIVIGGVSINAQVKSLAAGVDILIATPGRLVDLMKMGAVRLDMVEVLVLDEADRMLDMGFIHAIREIARKLPATRQNLFFSATMPTMIDGLAKTLLKNPASVAVTPVAKTADRVEQHVIHVRPGAKMAALTAVLSGPTVERVLVFARTKRGADRIVRGLEPVGIQSEAIHGNKSQPQREKALANFRSGRIRVLVATDIAARGIDVPEITHVVNYDLPNEPESYVHRIGRTARAGAAGVAISLCDGGEERDYLRLIEKLIRQPIPVMAEPAAVPGQAPREWTVPVDNHHALPNEDRPRQQHRRGQQPAGNRPAGMAGVGFMAQGKDNAARRHAPKRDGAPAAAAGERTASAKPAAAAGRPPRRRRPRPAGARVEARAAG